VPSARVFLRALLPFALHGLAREVDRALGLLLRSSLTPSSVPAEVARVVAEDGGSAALRLLAWVGGGALLWLALALGRRDELGVAAALGRESKAFAALYLRPALTVLALISVAIRPAFPYAFTLPVALSQDWSLGQDVAALAVVVARIAPPFRLPAPRPAGILFASLLVYSFLTPEWARQWEGHPGNEPKYLRMAVALGHELTLDAEGVSAPMEELRPRPLGANLSQALRTLAGESGRLANALLAGPSALGKDAIEATRITRQTVRGKEGGIYYVLAPGPSLVLAPALRWDRALNLAHGTPGRVAVSVLLWNLLAAALVAAVFLLARDTTGRPDLAAAVALGTALVPPFLFYGFQFYPEMPGALVLALLFHRFVFVPRWTARGAWLVGGLLATLPWLHQKFLPVWLVLTLTAAWRLRSSASPAAWAGLLLPQAATLYLTALYNFAITGSVRPDALFLAWGPGGVTSERLGQGVLGLLFDARYGILPYVPIFLVGGAGKLLGGVRRFVLVLPAACVYYLTVASADNWAGAVSNLGRYFMPIAPLAVALVALALDRIGAKRGAWALALMLAAWSAVFAVALWRDPHAANDSGELLAKSTYADGNQYIPNLHVRQWAEAAPGLGARVAAWLLLSGAVAGWLAWVATRRGGESPFRVLATTAAVLLLVGFGLERWPTAEKAPRFHESIAIGPEMLAFFDGRAAVRENEAVLGPGRTTLLVRAPGPVPSVRAVLGGQGLVRMATGGTLTARPTGSVVELPLTVRHTVRGPHGETETFSQLRLAVEGEVLLRFGENASGPRQ